MGLDEIRVRNGIRLHLDTVEWKEVDLIKEDESIYEVHGKVRPMIILRELKKRARRRKWFIVVELFSDRDKAGTAGRHMKSIGNCIRKDKESWVCLRPSKIPENMLQDFIEPCDGRGFEMGMRIVMSMVSRMLLGFDE